MKNRELCVQGPDVTECGLGCWQLGGGWGNPWNDATAQEILGAAYAAGVRFFDTADVYEDGASERSIGVFRRTSPDIFVATKLGRGSIYPDGFTREAMRAATEHSMANLGVDRIDLTQLHCVPTEVLREGKVFDWLRELREDGLIARFGASVETVEEGLICLEQEGVSSLQIIFNIFRQKPLRELLPIAREKGVGIIVRLPLASGLLAGELTKATVFKEGDHRKFNRDGDQFNVGETFAGLPYDQGLELSDEIKAMVPEGMSFPQMALRWILDCNAVSVVIPGASSSAQAQANAGISDLPPLPEALHLWLAEFYTSKVHDLVRGPY